MATTHPPPKITEITQHDVRRVLLLVASALVLLWLLLSDNLISSWSLREIGILSIALVTGSLLIIATALPRGIWSVTWMYTLVFSLFHFGLSLVFVLDPELPTDVQDYFRLWLRPPFVNRAMWLSLIALVTITIVAQIVGFAAGKRGRLPSHEPAPDRLPRVGAVLLYLTIPVFMIYLLRSGGNLLGNRYSAFQESLGGDSTISYLIYLLGAGLVFTVSGPPSRTRRNGLIAFGVVATFCLYLGLRSAVMFPALAAALVAARTRRPSAKATLVVLVGALCAISLVRSFRSAGIEPSPTSISPTLAVVEMGVSIRPVAEVQRWESEGVPHAVGATYLEPFAHWFHRITGTAEVDPAHDPTRIVNLLNSHRVGPIGFSPVAEGYYNFEVGGVIAFGVFAGLLLGFLDTRRLTTRNNVIVGLVMLPMLYTVRNLSTAVPAQIILGGVLLAVGGLASKAGPSRAPRRRISVR